VPPVTPGDLTSEWLSSVFGEPVTVTAAAPIGDGHLSTTIRLTLATADGDVPSSVPSSVVAKVPAEDDRSRQLAQSVRCYEREVKLFEELAPTVDIRMPRCYHAEWEPTSNDYVVLLEDMAPAEQGDQIAGCSVDRAELAVRELTKLHGPRWNDPTLADIDWLSGNEPSSSAEGYGAVWAMVFPGFAATYEAYLTAEQLDLAERFGDHIVTFFTERRRPYSIVHTDYRLDNMLFGTAEGGPPITVVDWGSPAHAPPITDLSYFCGAGLVVDDRRASERDLVAVYADALRAYDVTVDQDWLWEQYRRQAFHGLFITAMTSQMVTMNDRSLDMFGAMASRHLQHALDLDSLALL
jgi:hypothetical protein